jgi:hypothetical protein
MTTTDTPPGVRRFEERNLFGELISWADLSECTAHVGCTNRGDARYRYELGRRWDDGPLLEWIMLNPSTATHTVNDPTVRRCIGFAQQWGYGAIVIRNRYAYRATQPDELCFVDDPLGPANHMYLMRADADCTIVAWGASAPPDWPLPGRNISGSPIHPLYVRADVTPTEWVA